MSGRRDSDSANIVVNLGNKMRAAKMKMPIGAKVCLLALTGKAAALFLLLLSLMTVAASVDPASAQPANPYDFKKEAFKPDGTPWTGPVMQGDIIKYVLSYKPGPTNSGPVTIDDTLSPNQTYVPPTKASDSGWTWGSSPYSTGNHETYKHPGFGPGTGKVKVTVAGPAAPTHDVGDGTKPVPVGNRVFGVYHHALTDSNSTPKIDCWDLATLVKCPGYPKPNYTGKPIATPMEPSAVIRGSKIFFIGTLSTSVSSAGVGSTTGIPTIGCFDTATDLPCPDTPLNTGAVGGPAGFQAAFGGLSEDPVSGSVFAVVNDKVFCQTWSGSAWINCLGGWAATGTIAITGGPQGTSYPNNMVNIHVEQSPAPTRVYVHVGQNKIQCLLIASGAPCSSSWPAAGVTLPGPGGASTFMSVPAGTGENGVCLWSWTAQPVGCLDTTGAALTAPASVGGVTASTFRIPNSGRIFFGQHSGDGRPVCKEFTGSTAAACPGFVAAAPVPISGTFALTYGYALDPLDPAKCMLALGHTNWLWRFDWHTGEVGCAKPVTVQTPKIEDIYCNGAPNPATFHWNSIHVVTAGAAGTLTIIQGTATPVSLTITSGTTNYSMPGSIGAGYGPLSFSFAPAAGAPTTVDLEIGFTSDKNPQICYQAQVKSCGGPVFNAAVFKGNFNNAPVNVSQKVDLGKAMGPDCPELAGCLKDMKVAVKCNPNGTYTVTLAGGFTGNDITLTSQTAGITVTPPMQPDAPTTTWTVSGAAAGQIVALTANATKVGGGKEDGTDQCCSGEITIVMPECKKPPIDVAIGKENAPAGGLGNGFNIWVTNVGAPITFPAGAGGLTVTDVIPPGITIASVTAPNWTCKPVPLTGPGTMTCTYNLAGSLATGAQLSDAIVVNAVITNHEQPLKNCAQIAIGATVGLDTNPSNNQACVPVIGTGLGKLVVEKKVKNSTNAPSAMIDALVFPIGVTCGPPSNLNASFGLHNGGSHTENNIAVGSVCKVTEAISTLPPAPPRRICGDGLTAVWAPPVITPTSATIGSGTTVFTVVNELTCKKTGDVGSLVVTKKVIDHSPLPIPASQTYPVTVTCGGIVKNLTLVEGVSQTVSNIPLGTSCSVVEGTVPTLPNVCPLRTTPVWSTVYVPPSPVVVNAATTAVTIVNTLTCSQLQRCLPPLIPGAIPGTCVCPRGDVLVGKECVKPPICKEPKTLVGVQCICPPGFVQKGEDCVKQPICLPSQILVEGQCVCPPGTVLKGRECVKPIDCLPGQILVGGKCVCPPGTVQQGQACVKPGCDLPGMITGPGGRCICPPGTVQQGRECVKQPACLPSQVLVEGKCVCPPGTVQDGKECVKRPVCEPPARLNRRGECQCPDDMVAVGKTCVPRKREPPHVTPAEPPRGGGRDNEPPRGGGRDNDPPRGGQGPDLPGRR
jgi:hypothetical protein